VTPVRTQLALLAALALGAWGGGVLSGCTYTVEVRNATADPITVRLIQLDPIQPEWLLASARIDPGERAHLRESRAAFSKVVLEATTPGRDGEPVRHKVTSGRTVFRIEPGPGLDEPIVFRDDPSPWVSPSNRIRQAGAVDGPPK
jgi:hypothetical protein